MKTRVTLKLKHLVMILMAIFIILPLSGMFILPQIELMIAKHNIANGEMRGKEQIFAVLEDKIMPSQKYKIIQKYFLEDDGLDNYDIYVGPMSTSSYVDADSVRFSWEDKFPYLEDYLKNGPIDYYLVEVARNLAGDAAQREDFDRVETIYDLAFERFEQSGDDFQQYELNLTRIQLLLKANQLDLAEKHIQDMLTKIPDEQSYYQAEAAKYYAEVMVRQGKKTEALGEVQKALKEYEADYKKEENEEAIEQVVVYEQLKRMESQLLIASDIYDGEGTTVSGKVTRDDGTPIAHTGIYLREANYVNQSISRDEMYQVTTDENGNYEIENVTPGNYQIYAGFMFDDIDGYTWPVDMNDWIVVGGDANISYDINLAETMEVLSPVNGEVLTKDEIYFVWEEIEKASYYMIEFHVEEENASYGYSLDMKFTETEATIPIETLYSLGSNSILSKEETEEDYFSPATLLGFANPKGKFSWGVQAYDENGKLLTQSGGYRLNEGTIGNLPILYLEERELTEADEQLLDSKLEEALASYKKAVKEDPRDVHSLRMITNVIGIEGDGTWETLESLRIPYVEKLAEITKDTRDIYEVVNYYYELKNWEAYKKWYEFYKEEHDGSADPFVKSMHANALMYQGDYAEAANLQKQALEEGASNQFTGNLIALELYLGIPIDVLLEHAKKYPYIHYDNENSPGIHWENNLNEIQKELAAHPDTVEELKKGLEYYFKNDTKKIQAWKKTANATFEKFISSLEAQ